MYDERKTNDRRGGGKRTFFYKRKKVCKLCEEKIEYVDWKDVKFLMGFIPLRSKILPRRISGTCSHHQRMLAKAIKRSRNTALIPFATD
jgi:small subunit ribosomal protein S18